MQGMHTIDLRLLRGFLAVVESGSITAAAERIRLSQPALSRQVSDLEKRLELTLFDRSPTSLRLTAAGRWFVPLARDLLDQADGLQAAARRLSTGKPNHFRVICPEATVRGVIAPFVAATGAPIADTALDIASRVYSHVLNREVDLAINTLAPPLTLASRQIDDAGLWVYLPPDHRLASREEVPVGELVRDPLIVLATGSGLRHVIDEALQPVRDRVALAAEPISSDLALAMAAAGRGICIDVMPASFSLVRLPFVHADGTRVTMPVHAAWEREHFAAREIEALADALAQWAQERTDR